jgi:predicted AAA+ superfamily ATPase
MAISNQERVGKALELLNTGLKPFIEREMKAVYDKRWQAEMQSVIREDRISSPSAGGPQFDTQALLTVMWEHWSPQHKKPVFGKILGQSERNLVAEIRHVRNQWAHQHALSTDDAYRALDSIARLLGAVSAPESAEVEKQKIELLRTKFDEQARREVRKASIAPVEGQPTGGLKPWREIVTPHPDVASGKFQQAEFAADLWQVYVNEGSDEYRDPKEFFRRTFLTEGLRRLLTGALRRLNGTGGDPVIELQTNFGGGKTHSMLALFHLFSGVTATELPGVEPLLTTAEVTQSPKVKRVVLVGNKISPGQPSRKDDGTIVRTLWGELAWQLGGREAFELIRESDETSTNPGDSLRILFNKYAPCLILIDEWVAYARQLHDQNDLPAGTFETHFTFAQTLSEAAKAADRTMLVVSIPASEDPRSHQVSDVEVGGERGRAALERLKNAIGRVESPWRPASAEEGFEIVRRRLFQPITDNLLFVARDAVVKAFADVYRTQPQEFPPDCREGDYERRLKAAYPIHPELFDRLYEDWSSLAKFQRTRGVLRLMAAVIHALWEREDKNLLILPANVPVDDQGVQFELTRYLEDQWLSVIEKDVDGAYSLPLKLDRENPNLGRFSASRRVARTLYLGSAPTLRAANRGLEERQIKLGCVQPGESVATFGDALRRLTDQATFLYVDGKRYWYSTQPSVTKLAEDRAAQLSSDDITQEIKNRIKEEAKTKADFVKVSAEFPTSSSDIPDEQEVRLVILDSEHPHSNKDKNSQAMKLANSVLDFRGTSPRNCKNMLVFLAADGARLKELEQGVRQYLAWKSIHTEAETLNLDAFQKKQAETKLANAEATVKSRIPETYIWLIYPEQETPDSPIELQESRLQGPEQIVKRASKKLTNDDQLILVYSPKLLKGNLDKIPLWRSNHVGIKQLAEDFARYVYLPRLRNTEVLLDSIREGLRLITWEVESFAYSDGWDESRQKYSSLRAGSTISVAVNSDSVLVKPDVAVAQLEAEIAKQNQSVTFAAQTTSIPQTNLVETTVTSEPIVITPTTNNPIAPIIVPKPQPTRFYGAVELENANRLGRDAGRIAEEVLQHLAGLMSAKVKITIEIQADIPDGVPENIVRTVTENCRTLKFKEQGFEKD